MLDDLSGGADGAAVVVVCFTMWCSTCAAHTESLATMIKPTYVDKGRDVRYLIVDYVSESMMDMVAANDISPRFGFRVLSDYQNIVKDQLHGGMGVTAVIDNDGTIFYNLDSGTGLKVMEAIDNALAN